MSTNLVSPFASLGSNPACHRGNRKLHRWRRVAPNRPVCVECEERPATRNCHNCDEVFCDICYKNMHRKGRRKYHAFDLIKDPLPEGATYCTLCQVVPASDTCVQCSKGFCDACRLQVSCDVVNYSINIPCVSLVTAVPMFSPASLIFAAPAPRQPLMMQCEQPAFAAGAQQPLHANR